MKPADAPEKRLSELPGIFLKVYTDNESIEKEMYILFSMKTDKKRAAFLWKSDPEFLIRYSRMNMSAHHDSC